MSAELQSPKLALSVSNESVSQGPLGTVWRSSQGQAPKACSKHSTILWKHFFLILQGLELRRLLVFLVILSSSTRRVEHLSTYNKQGLLASGQLCVVPMDKALRSGRDPNISLDFGADPHTDAWLTYPDLTELGFKYLVLVATREPCMKQTFPKSKVGQLALSTLRRTESTLTAETLQPDKRLYRSSFGSTTSSSIPIVHLQRCRCQT